MKKSYKIINTTVKQPKLHPKTGQDLRNMTEKVGHNVKFITDDGKEVIVERHRPRIVNHVNEGMLRLQRGKFIRIEEIDDVTAVLKKHSFQSSDKMLEPDEDAKEFLGTHPSSEKRMAKAVEMGTDTHTQKGGLETEGAVNPDGDPNFVVKTSQVLKKKKTRVEDVPSSEAPLDL